MADHRSISALASVVEDILACAEAGLGDDAPQRAYPAPGAEVAWDCEQLWVRVANIAPTMPAQAQTLRRPCGPSSWTVVLAVGVLRCVATVNDQGQPPNATQLGNDGTQMLSDLEALRNALLCCEAYPLDMGPWVPLGPEGGYAGGEWQVSLLMMN